MNLPQPWERGTGFCLGDLRTPVLGSLEPLHSPLEALELEKRFLSERPRMLQTPTTQLLAGEVLPGFLQAPSDQCVSKELVRLHVGPFAACQDSCPHHELDQNGALCLWPGAGQDALCVLAAVTHQYAPSLPRVTCSKHPLPCRGPQGFSQSFALHSPCCEVGGLLRAPPSTWAVAQLSAAVLGCHFGIAQSYFALLACYGPQ